MRVYHDASGYASYITNGLWVLIFLKAVGLKSCGWHAGSGAQPDKRMVDAEH